MVRTGEIQDGKTLTACMFVQCFCARSRERLTPRLTPITWPFARHPLLQFGMPAQTYDALLRSLPKGELAPVYYLHGPEDILKDEAVQAILDRALDPGLRDFNFDQRSAGQLDPEAIFSLCTTLPMMAERRVVVLRDVEGWKRKPKTRAAFLKYLERPAAETVVILVQGSAEEEADKDLVRGAFAVACEPLPPERARRWLLRRAGALGVDARGRGGRSPARRDRRRARRAWPPSCRSSRALPAGAAAHGRAGRRAGRRSARRDDLRLARRRAGRRRRPRRAR